MDRQLDWQCPAHPWNPALDYDAETTVQRALNGTGGGWPLHVQVVLPLRALVALGGRGQRCHVLASLLPSAGTPTPPTSSTWRPPTASAWAARPWSSWRRSSSWVPS